MRNERAFIGTIVLCTMYACSSDPTPVGGDASLDDGRGLSGATSSSGRSGRSGRLGQSGTTSGDAQGSPAAERSGTTAGNSSGVAAADATVVRRDSALDARLPEGGSPRDAQADDGRQVDGASDASDADVARTGNGGATELDCGVQPVTPGATQQTRKVLCYLHSVVGKQILSGQEEDNSDEAMDYIFQHTGKYPAIRAFDLNNSKAPGQCVEHSKKGGLCMFGYHMGINGQKYDVAVNMDRVVATGTAENQSLNQRLDDVASAFQKLQQVDGVGIVRLFHEVGNGCSWFWWSKGSAQQYVALWKYAFRYLTATKGLKNTLWLVPHCASTGAAWNPGKEYVDIGGSDTYKSRGDYQPLTSQFNDTQKAFPSLPIALHENGPIPDPDLLESTKTRWVLFNTWSDHFDTSNNSVDHLKKVYGHPYVVTLDELPTFR